MNENILAFQNRNRIRKRRLEIAGRQLQQSSATPPQPEAETLTTTPTETVEPVDLIQPIGPAEPTGAESDEDLVQIGRGWYSRSVQAQNPANGIVAALKQQAADERARAHTPETIAQAERFADVVRRVSEAENRPDPRLHWEMAVVALLNNRTFVRAAKECQMHERTLRKLMENHEFLEIYWKAQDAVIQHSVEAHKNMRTRAFTRLAACLGSQNDTVALRAVTLLLANSTGGPN